MWNGLLDAMLKRLVKKGSLTLHAPDGRARTYGNGAEPRVTVRIKDPAWVGRLVRDPDLTLGEAYMEGALTIDNDDLHSLFAVVYQNQVDGHSWWWYSAVDRMRVLLRRFEQWNPAHRSKENVAHHYDLSADFYKLFLDADRQYSCAYFADPAMALEDAQIAKKAHIAKKLLIKPGDRVLDIGCGWGGMGLTLARDYGARVLGVTLSEEQLKIARERAKAEGLEDRVQFELIDYRKVEGKFDRIVSVGMFEHVGVPHFQEYFDKVAELLAPDGVALIHTIGRAGPPSVTSAWISKYIFPGGYIPSLSEMMLPIEKSGLYQTDIEIWRIHYAETLLHWQKRFTANIDAVRKIYDERFCRMWMFYLVASEMAFRDERKCVFHVQLAHKATSVPLTRDYLHKG